MAHDSKVCERKSTTTSCVSALRRVWNEGFLVHFKALNAAILDLATVPLPPAQGETNLL